MWNIVKPCETPMSVHSVQSWLVVPTPLKNMSSSVGMINHSHIWNGNHKSHVPNHQPESGRFGIPSIIIYLLLKGVLQTLLFSSANGPVCPVCPCFSPWTAEFSAAPHVLRPLRPARTPRKHRRRPGFRPSRRRSQRPWRGPRATGPGANTGEHRGYGNWRTYHGFT